MYYAYLLAMLLLMRGLERSPHTFPVTIVTPVWFFLFFLQNLNPASLFSFRDSLFSITWSLCIEEHFYLLWPVCVRRFSRRGLLQLLSMTIVLSPLLRLAAAWWLRGAPYSQWYQTITRFTPLHLDAIAAGCILGLVWTGQEDRATRLIADPQKPSPSKSPTGAGRFAACFLVGLLAAILCFHLRLHYGVFSFCFTALALCFAGLVGLALEGWFGPVFLSQPLRYLGKISYGLYLIHPSIFLFLQSHHLLERVGWKLHPALVESCAALAALSLSIGLAALSWEFYERRVLALKTRLAP